MRRDHAFLPVVAVQLCSSLGADTTWHDRAGLSAGDAPEGILRPRAMGGTSGDSGAVSAGQGRCSLSMTLM